MIYSSFRVIGDEPSDRLVTGRRRAPVGTGFFVTVPSLADRNVRYGYAVTAQHVIEKAGPIVDVQAPNPFGSGELYDPVRVEGWRQPLPGVDLAVAPFDHRNEDQRVYSSLEIERHFLPHDLLPGLGTIVYYVGFLAPLNRAMARSGTIGALNQEGIDLEEYEYTAHLVDCRSYGGFSGSPCFVEMRYAGLTPTTPNHPLPADWPPTPLGNIHYFVMLCGMFTAHIENNPPNEAASRYGVGIMLRSQEIWEALMTDELQQQRRDEDANLAPPEPGSPRARQTSTEPDDEFARFEELTRRLVNTPKPKQDETSQ